jgi:hypothetical protein
MKKLTILYLMLTALVSPTGSVRAQTAVPLAASEAAVVGGAYVGKKVIGACIRHPFLCAATVTVGAAYVSKVAHETQKLNAQTPPCNGDYVPLYRAVGKIERMEIAAIQRYVILPTGIGAKQFMLRLEDAKWIVGFNQQYETTPTKEMFIVTSSACAATLAMADKFTDAGRAVVSFGQEALQMVNLDDSRSGGIQEIWASGAVK